MAYEFKKPMEGVGFVEIPASGITTNIYAVGSPDEAILVDAGTADVVDETIETLEANGYGARGIRAIVVTHGHLDHYGGACRLAQWSGAGVWAHSAAAARIESHWMDFISRFDPGPNPQSWETFRDRSGEDVQVERILRDGDVIDIADWCLEVLHTPGHEHGLITLFAPERRAVFVGDLGRLDAIEEALLQVLVEQESITVAGAAREIYRRVLDVEQNPVLPYTLMTTGAFLKDLRHRGKVRQAGDYHWSLA